MGRCGGGGEEGIGPGMAMQVAGVIAEGASAVVGDSNVVRAWPLA